MEQDLRNRVGAEGVDYSLRHQTSNLPDIVIIKKIYQVLFRLYTCSNYFSDEQFSTGFSEFV